jgi:hypothetical protein
MLLFVDNADEATFPTNTCLFADSIGKSGFTASEIEVKL